jgi:hypothetical protein
MGQARSRFRFLVDKLSDRSSNFFKNMATYSEVITQVKALSTAEQLQLLEALKALVAQSGEVEADNEVVSPEEIAESESAWQDYLAGRDRGISSQELKQKLRDNQVG